MKLEGAAGGREGDQERVGWGKAKGGSLHGGGHSGTEMDAGWLARSERGAECRVRLRVQRKGSTEPERFFLVLRRKIGGVYSFGLPGFSFSCCYRNNKRHVNSSPSDKKAGQGPRSAATRVQQGSSRPLRGDC